MTGLNNWPLTVKYWKTCVPQCEVLLTFVKDCWHPQDTLTIRLAQGKAQRATAPHRPEDTFRCPQPGPGVTQAQRQSACVLKSRSIKADSGRGLETPQTPTPPPASFGELSTTPNAHVCLHPAAASGEEPGPGPGCDKAPQEVPWSSVAWGKLPAAAAADQESAGMEGGEYFLSSPFLFSFFPYFLIQLKFTDPYAWSLRIQFNCFLAPYV